MKAIYAILLVGVALTFCSAARYAYRSRPHTLDDLGICGACKDINSGCPCWNVDLCSECCEKDKKYHKCTSSDCDKSQSEMPDWVQRCNPAKK